MTYGGAGAIFPILVLFALALPIILLWVFRGAGSFQKRRLIGCIQFTVLAISMALFFTEIARLQTIGICTAFFILLSMLLTPIVFKNRV